MAVMPARSRRASARSVAFAGVVGFEALGGVVRGPAGVRVRLDEHQGPAVTLGRDGEFVDLRRTAGVEGQMVDAGAQPVMPVITDITASLDD